MKNNSIKVLVLASVLLASSVAQAAVSSFTQVISATDEWFYNPIKHLRGGGTFSFSGELIGTLEAIGIQTSAVSPATVSIAPPDDGTQLSANTPLLSMSGDIEDTTGEATLTYIATFGGASMVAPKKNAATHTGSLSLTGITIDLSSKSIHADLTGGNGVGTWNDVLVWHYTDITGPTGFFVYGSETRTVMLHNRLTGLKITEEAFNLFASSLGLTHLGMAAMREIDDYGVMETQVLFELRPFPLTPTVPEPSVYMMAGLGLMGLLIASKRIRHA